MYRITSSYTYGRNQFSLADDLKVLKKCVDKVTSDSLDFCAENCRKQQVREKCEINNDRSVKMNRQEGQYKLSLIICRFK